LINLTSFITFAIATLILNLTPGPDMMYIAARSMGQGRRAGVISALGVGAGILVHTFAAVFGLAALLRSLPLAFNVVRYAGAGYLIFLGIRLLVRPGSRRSLEAPAPANSAAVFRQGMITNVLNPNVALFFLAFLPQFVSPARGSVAAQMALLGLWFNFSGTLVNLAVAGVAGVAGNLFRSRDRWRIAERASGLVFIGLGLRVAIARHT
jgi:threonine/homoserine/homoserine lactone efflux protein